MIEATGGDDQTRIIRPGQITLARHVLETRGPAVHELYKRQPKNATRQAFSGRTIDELRDWLKQLENGRAAGDADQSPFPQPFPVSVEGTLFPCGLLSAGWWQRLSRDRARELRWKSDVQRWHFIGFNEWAPSWDFTWSLDNWERTRDREHFFAQFGDGDEGNSLPVSMTRADAEKVRENLDTWGGMTARVTGLLGHRTQFPLYGRQLVKDASGWLNYCLWIDPNKTGHGIEPVSGQPSVYSGYLWQCVAPRRWVAERALGPEDVFFVWVHTDFSRPDAVAFSRDELAGKVALMERHVRERTGDGDFQLLAKSSHLLDGAPFWNEDEVDRLLDMRRVPRRPPAGVPDDD